MKRPPIPSHIETLAAYTSARSTCKGDQWVFFDANESPVSLIDPGEVIAGVRLNRYPDPTSDVLRDALAPVYGVERRNIIVANGSDELIDLAVRCFVDPSRCEVVTSPRPSYGFYKVVADQNNLPFTPVPLRADFSLDADALLAAAVPGGVIFLCNPNNPTATLIDDRTLRAIVRGFSGLVVLDEAYAEFAEAEGMMSGAALINEGAKNLLVLRTFSKAFGAASLRLGYGIASPEIIDVLMKAKGPYNVNALSQMVGLELWKRRPVLLENVRAIITERDRLIVRLRDLGCCVLPTAANFLLFRPPEGVSADGLFDALKRQNLVLRRFSDPAMQGLLRMSVSRPEEDDRVLAAMQSFISSTSRP